jgi:hypothetical protein
LRLGFKNFSMDQFGVQRPPLKRIARTPEPPRVLMGQSAEAAVQPESGRDRRTAMWMGATVKNTVGMGEISASGLPGEVGVLLLGVPLGSRAASFGLREGDVVLVLPDQGQVRITIWRQQNEATIEVDTPIR